MKLKNQMENEKPLHSNREMVAKADGHEMPSEQLLIVKIVYKWQLAKKARSKERKRSDVVCLVAHSTGVYAKNLLHGKPGVDSFVLFFLNFGVNMQQLNSS